MVKLILVCLTTIPALDSCYPRRKALSLCAVAIGGLTAWIGDRTCGVDYKNEYLVVIHYRISRAVCTHARILLL